MPTNTNLPALGSLQAVPAAAYGKGVNPAGAFSAAQLATFQSTIQGLIQQGNVAGVAEYEKMLVNTYHDLLGTNQQGQLSSLPSTTGNPAQNILFGLSALTGAGSNVGAGASNDDVAKVIQNNIKYLETAKTQAAANYEKTSGNPYVAPDENSEVLTGDQIAGLDNIDSVKALNAGAQGNNAANAGADIFDIVQSHRRENFKLVLPAAFKPTGDGYYTIGDSPTKYTEAQRIQLVSDWQDAHNSVYLGADDKTGAPQIVSKDDIKYDPANGGTLSLKVATTKLVPGNAGNAGADGGRGSGNNESHAEGATKWQVIATGGNAAVTMQNLSYGWGLGAKDGSSARDYNYTNDKNWKANPQLTTAPTLPVSAKSDSVTSFLNAGVTQSAKDNQNALNAQDQALGGSGILAPGGSGSGGAGGGSGASNYIYIGNDPDIQQLVSQQGVQPLANGTITTDQWNTLWYQMSPEMQSQWNQKFAAAGFSSTGLQDSLGAWSQIGSIVAQEQAAKIVTPGVADITPTGDVSSQPTTQPADIISIGQTFKNLTDQALIKGTTPEDALKQQQLQEQEKKEAEAAKAEAKRQQEIAAAAQRSAYKVALEQFGTANNLGLDDHSLGNQLDRLDKGVSLDQIKQEYREQLASQYASQYKDAILGGTDIRTIAGTYINAKASLFEEDPNNIDLSDNDVQSALHGNGKESTDLGTFTTKLKQDDRYLTTAAANNDILPIIQQMRQDFGKGF